MELQLAIVIISALLGAAGTIISTLVLFNLRSMVQRIDALEQSHRLLSERRADCQRDFVSTEQWVRSESTTRTKLDTLIQSFATLQGNLKVVEQLPQIAGNIAREVASNLKIGEAHAP